MNLNRAMIIGNLTRDPEVRNTPNGTPVASFAVATNQVWMDQSGQKQERVEFHNIVAWKRLAEICGQYLRKGSKIYVDGRLQTRDWTGQDNVKRYRTEIVVENMIMLDRAGTPAAGGSGFGHPAQTPQNEFMPIEQSMGGNDQSANFDPQEDEIKVENIPF